MKKKEEVDVDKELKIILEFLANLKVRQKAVHEVFKKYQESFQKTDKTEEQIKIWDKALNEFVFFHEDEDLAGERVKMISRYLMDKAKKEKVSETTANLMKKDRWVFDW